MLDNIIYEGGRALSVNQIIFYLRGLGLCGLFLYGCRCTEKHESQEGKVIEKKKKKCVMIVEKDGGKAIVN